MPSFRSWPSLRRLEIWGMEHNLQLVEKIIRGAPILQELTLYYFNFEDPAVLQSLAAVACNAPSVDLKWHLNFCEYHPNTIAVWEEIVTWEKAKSMRVSFEVRDVGHCKVAQAILSQSSCVGELHVKCFSNRGCSGGIMGDFAFEFDQTLQQLLRTLHKQQLTSANPLTSLEFNMHTTYLEQYLGVIASIPHWTPRVKELRLFFETDSPANRRRIRTKLLDAVWKNMHLQSINLMFLDNEYQELRTLLYCYEKRNRKLQLLDEADSIPLYVWPYVYHLASRGGADMLYRLLHQNVGYIMVESCHCPAKRHQ